MSIKLEDEKINKPYEGHVKVIKLKLETPRKALSPRAFNSEIRGSPRNAYKRDSPRNIVL
jgi:hypothetical protein